MNSTPTKNQVAAKMLTGIFIIGFGVLILLKQTGMPIPSAVTGWEMILILVGLVNLVKHGFQHITGYVILAIGGIFMLNDFYPDLVETRFIWPIVIIVMGLSVLFKAFRTNKTEDKVVFFEDKQATINNEDFVNSTAFFSGVNKNIVSKNFKGAKISSIFGGTQLNLTHADIQESVTFDISCYFGGVELNVPSSWKVQDDLTSVFGGVDDKRNITLVDENSDKKIILKGSVFFGGIEISNHG